MAALKLRDLRYNRGLSPEQLGELIEVSGRTIRRLEEGHKPTPETALKVASFFGLAPTDLWPLDEEPAEAAA